MDRGTVVTDHPSRHVVAEWVRAQRANTPAAKLILQLVFDHAGPQEDGRWVAWVGNRTLAWEACFAGGPNGARTVRRHLADLETAGIIEREERTRGNGSQTTNRVVLLVPADWGDRGGRAPGSGGGGLASPPQKPQQEAPAGSPSRGERSARDDIKSQIPDGFPDELRPHAREVMRILRAIAEDHPAAKAVWPREVGLAIMAYPRRPLVEAAHDLAGWAVDAKRPIKDVVATYRTFLKRERDRASIERLAGDGTPTTEPQTHGLNVHPIAGRRGMSNNDQVEANIRALDAAAEHFASEASATFSSA